MTKKAGILTWHYLDNYGSVLQAYALKKVLQNKNINTEFINYRENAKTGLIYDVIRFLKYNLPVNNSSNIRKSKFYKFRKLNFNETKMFSSYNNLKNTEFDYDFVVCGSDQIWSQRRFDDVYFFSFLSNEKIKKYSYAASTMEEYSNIQQEKVKKYLKDFKKISVREKKGVEIIKKYTEKKVEEVLDPTLLLNEEEWKNIIDKKDLNIIPKSKYLLCYFIGQDNKYEKQTMYLKEKYKCDEIINIEITGIHNFGTIVNTASPTEFLNLILNAEIVVTDSYHGVLFSINLNKEFVAIKRFDDEKKDNQNERIYNILNKLNLNERYISASEQKNIGKKIDYNKVKKDLQPYIDNSYKYIESIVGEDKND